MLERGRGARRDRTRRFKERGYQVVRREINDLAQDHISWGQWFDDHGKRHFGHYWEPGRQPTHAELNGWLRRYRKNEGRNNQFDHHCGDCFAGTGKCDYCGPAKIRHRRKEHESLDADLAQYDPYDDYQYSGWSPYGLWYSREDGEDWYDPADECYPLWRRVPGYGYVRTPDGNSGCCPNCLGLDIDLGEWVHAEENGVTTHTYVVTMPDWCIPYRPWHDWWRWRDGGYHRGVFHPRAPIAYWEYEYGVELVWVADWANRPVGDESS